MTSENSQHFTMPSLVSPQNDIWETSAEIPYWSAVSLPRSEWCFWLVENCFIQSEVQWCFIRVEFLHFFLRHHFTGKPVVAWWDVSCFIRQIPEKVMRSLNTIYIINGKSQMLLSRFFLRGGGNCTQACDQSILLALFCSLMIDIQWCRVFLHKFTMNVTYKNINNQQITHDEISRTCISLLLEYVQSCKNIQLSPSWQKSKGKQ